MAKRIELITQVDVLDTAELSATEKDLLAQAQAATANAYAPYSGFLVGAALLLEDGTIHRGNNQENAAYPSGLCAERTALFGLRANNPHQKIRMMAVTARRSGTENFVPAMPCGSCRQVMLEYESQQQSPIAILVQAGPEQVYRLQATSLLLPLNFTKADLGL